MNDENLRLTGSANTPYQNFTASGTATTFNGTTAQFFGKNRQGLAKLYVNGTINANSTASLGIVIQQATTSNTTSANWFDIAIFPAIIADGGTTNNTNGADQTGQQRGVETSAFSVKSEIPGTQPLIIQFTPSMDWLRIRATMGAATTANTYQFNGIGVEVEDAVTPFPRSGT